MHTKSQTKGDLKPQSFLQSSNFFRGSAPLTKYHSNGKCNSGLFKDIGDICRDNIDTYLSI